MAFTARVLRKENLVAMPRIRQEDLRGFSHSLFDTKASRQFSHLIYLISSFSGRNHASAVS